MHKKQTLTFAGISALGAAALLLSGCGGSSFQKNTFGNYPNTLPYAYGQEPIAYYGLTNAIGKQADIEGSGLQAASGGQAYITGALAFAAVTANGATLPVNADPNGTGTLPLGFSTKGLYIDAANLTGATFATVTSVTPGTAVVFRAALANGISNNNAAGITSATLTSTDAQFASVAGLTTGLPMSLDVVGGAFANATYATGTGGTAVPFTIPAATTSGLHTVAVTVKDDAGRVTSTTFVFPVVAGSTVALFLQHLTADGQTGTPAATAITPGDTVTIDGGAGLGTYPAGYKPTIADTQGTVVFFVAPGKHTVVDTNVVPATAKAAAVTTVTTQTITVAAAAAGTTIIQ